MSEERRVQPEAFEKIPTGIFGLDEVLSGGIAGGCATLLSGGPGSGKTLLGVEMLVRNAREGRPGVMLTFEEQEREILRYSESFGWQVQELIDENLLTVIHARLPSQALISGEFDLGGVLSVVKHAMEHNNASIVMLDAIDNCLRIFGNRQQELAELQQLFYWFKEHDVTSIVTIKHRNEELADEGYDYLEYMSDCVIRLDQRVIDQISTRRLRVIKYRGTAHGRNEYPFAMTKTGLRVIPVTRTNLRHHGFREVISSGVAGLDEIINGGFLRNSCTLITGNTGTGKTTFASSFVVAAAALNEKILFIDFEESWEALSSCMRSPGIDLETPLKEGCLHFLSAMPESQGVEEHLIQAFEEIEAFEPAHVIVDAISACRRMGSRRGAYDYLIRMIDYCKQLGITTVLTNLTSASDPREELTSIDLSSMIDSVILLHHIDDGQGQYNRFITILKARGREHSHRVHPFRITGDGIIIDVKEVCHE